MKVGNVEKSEDPSVTKEKNTVEKIKLLYKGENKRTEKEVEVDVESMRGMPGNYKRRKVDMTQTVETDYKTKVTQMGDTKLTQTVDTDSDPKLTQTADTDGAIGVTQTGDSQVTQTGDIKPLETGPLNRLLVSHTVDNHPLETDQSNRLPLEFKPPILSEFTLENIQTESPLPPKHESGGIMNKFESIDKDKDMSINKSESITKSESHEFIDEFESIDKIKSLDKSESIDKNVKSESISVSEPCNLTLDSTRNQSSMFSNVKFNNSKNTSRNVNSKLKYIVKRKEVKLSPNSKTKTKATLKVNRSYRRSIESPIKVNDNDDDDDDEDDRFEKVEPDMKSKQKVKKLIAHYEDNIRIMHNKAVDSERDVAKEKVKLENAFDRLMQKGMRSTPSPRRRKKRLDHKTPLDQKSKLDSWIRKEI